VNTTELRDLADRLSGVDPAEIQAVLRTAASVYDNLSTIADKWNFEADELREDNKRLAEELVSARPAVPLTDEQLREAFGKMYPNDVGLLEFAESNRDFAIEAIGARHHWRAFEAGARAVEAANGIKPKGLFIDMIAQHEGLAEELSAIDHKPDWAAS